MTYLMHLFCSRITLCGWVARVCVLLCFTATAVAAADDPPTKTTDQKIRELIEKLGSDSYATRLRARNQLKTYGLEAFDALREAQNHDDSEILSAARYLISSLQVSWSKETDPREVREILLEYGAQTEPERLARIELLGRLRDGRGIEALTRLARFDRSVPLSRRAAMLVLQQPMAADRASRIRLADGIEQVIGENRRDATRWLLAYAQDLRDGQYSTQRWRDIVRQQRQTVDSASNTAVTSSSVMRLIRVLASRAIAEDLTDSARQLVMEHIDLVSPTTRDLSEHSAWSIRKGLFPVVLSLYQRHKNTFSDNAELLYSAAQAYEETGETEQAERLAADAILINPLPEIAADQPGEGAQNKPALSDHELQEIAYAHHQVAALLKNRGRFKWSERENRAVIKHCDIETIVGVSARQELARMFSEQLRHDDASEVLLPIADRLAKDRLYRSKMSRWTISLSRIRSLYEYESGLSILKNQDRTQENLNQVKQKLQLAYRFDNDNIDILIRMYRLDDPDDRDWKPTVLKQLNQNKQSLERQITLTESRKRSLPINEFREELGELYNQYAWLVSNTEGDFERALKCSLDSIQFLEANELDQRAARLDTCARCYFAIGNVNQAIEMQKQALAIDRYSPAMLRQLNEFESAL